MSFAFRRASCLHRPIAILRGLYRRYELVRYRVLVQRGVLRHPKFDSRQESGIGFRVQMLAIRAIPCVGAESRDWLRSHCSWAITPLYFDHNFTGRRTGVLSYGRSSRAVLVQLYGSTLCRAELPGGAARRDGCGGCWGAERRLRARTARRARRGAASRAPLGAWLVPK
jgi:hypothetical protein